MGKNSIHYWEYKGRRVDLVFMGLSYAIIRDRVEGSLPFVITNFRDLK